METADDLAPAALSTVERSADMYRPGRPSAEQSRIVAARRDRVEARYLAGATILEAAHEEGISCATAADDLHKLGVPMRRRGLRRKYGPDEQRPCALCGDGVLARAADIARGRRHFYCDSCKGDGRQKTKGILTPSERDELIVLLYVLEGRSQRYIGLRLGLSEAMIHRELRRLDLPTDMHRSGPRELCCAHCGTKRSTYDRDARFCSASCWGKWRWKHREGIDALADGFVQNWWGPRARQRWGGRWGGSVPADRRGRPRGYSQEQGARARSALEKGLSDEAAGRVAGMTRRQVQRLRTEPAPKPS